MMNQILNVLHRSATSLRNVNAASSDSSSNSSDLSNGFSNGEKDNRIDCDVKTLRLYSIHQVRNAFLISSLIRILERLLDLSKVWSDSEGSGKIGLSTWECWMKFA